MSAATTTASRGRGRADAPGALTDRPRALGAERLLDTRSTRSPLGRTNRLQRDTNGTCVDCGASVVRARRARGPLPARCSACTARRRPLAQLRAYLRAAGRLADQQGLDRVGAAIADALASLDLLASTEAGIEYVDPAGDLALHAASPRLLADAGRRRADLVLAVDAMDTTESGDA